MKIMIVGLGGQLGLDCQKVLAEKHQLITPNQHELNLCEYRKTVAYITACTPDVVINCAAYTAVDKCEEEQNLCRQINGVGPGILAEACEKINGRLIHISTDYVFDGQKAVPQPYTEDDMTNPQSHYGQTKLEGEYAVQRLCRNHIILRTAWLYSAHGPNFLKTMLRLSMADPTAQRKVVNDQYGSLTWSHTLARQISLLLDDEIKGLVHSAADGYSTWYEAAHYFLEKLGVQHNLVPCTTAEYPTPTARPLNSILANRILETRKLSVFIDWKKDLDEYIRQFGDELLADYR